MIEIPFAEDVNYWKTSQSGSDTWIMRAVSEIEDAGGQILGEAFGSSMGRSAFMLTFQIGEDVFRVVFPVLPTKTEKETDRRAARVQAATLLYHDVKAKCLTARILGVRSAFFSYLVLPGGKTAAEATEPELLERLPLLLRG